MPREEDEDTRSEIDRLLLTRLYKDTLKTRSKKDFNVYRAQLLRFFTHKYADGQRSTPCRYTTAMSDDEMNIIGAEQIGSESDRHTVDSRRSSAMYMYARITCSTMDAWSHPVVHRRNTASAIK